MDLRYVACVALGLFVSSAQAGSAPAAPPSFVNPDFEADGTGVAAPAGWESVGSTDADFTEPGGHVSPLRLTHWNPAAFDVETRQSFQGTAPGPYTFRAWVRRSAGENRSFVEVRCGHRVDRV